MEQGLTTAYSLQPLLVHPIQLLLDPTNPRLITSSTEARMYEGVDLVRESVQAEVLQRVCQKEHDVQRLIDSIGRQGFLRGLHPMIVRRIGRSDQLMVLEGNRRTAALRHLLARGDGLSVAVQESISEVEVHEFIYEPNSEWDEQEVLDVLLGTIHVDGPKEWGAMQKACSVHRSYVRHHKKLHGRRRKPRYDKDLAETVGSFFNVKPLQLRRVVTAHRVYEQLREADYEARPGHYSLIELAIRTRVVSGPYFGVDLEVFEMSEVGLERFAELCLGEAPAIHNPKLFKGFAFAYANGTDVEIRNVETKQWSIERVSRRIKGRLEKRAFHDSLIKIREELGNLRIVEFQGTAGEQREIRRIKKYVDRHLSPILRGR